jgi:hypothetical protein
MEKARIDKKFIIPKPLYEAFAEEMRIVIDPAPGLWPVDIRMLQHGLLDQLAKDKAFMDKYQIMITPRY